MSRRYGQALMDMLNRLEPWEEKHNNGYLTWFRKRVAVGDNANWTMSMAPNWKGNTRMDFTGLRGRLYVPALAINVQGRPSEEVAKAIIARTNGAPVFVANRRGHEGPRYIQNSVYKSTVMVDYMFLDGSITSFPTCTRKL